MHRFSLSLDVEILSNFPSSWKLEAQLETRKSSERNFTKAQSAWERKQVH